MSPNVSSFVSELAEMAQATMRLPQVEGELRSAQATTDELREQVQRLELKLLDRATEIDNLNQKVRKVEAERDDAELRFLELDERASTAYRRLADLEGLIGAAASLLERTPPVPTVPEAVAVQAEEPVPAGPVSEVPTSDGLGFTGDPANIDSVVMGQGAVDPTQPAVMADATISSVESATTIGVNNPLPVGPYVDKLYIHTSGWISRADWLAGGGTEETYDWRSGWPLPDGISWDTAYPPKSA